MKTYKNILNEKYYSYEEYRKALKKAQNEKEKIKWKIKQSYLKKSKKN